MSRRFAKEDVYQQSDDDQDALPGDDNGLTLE